MGSERKNGLSQQGGMGSNGCMSSTRALPGNSAKSTLRPGSGFAEAKWEGGTFHIAAIMNLREFSSIMKSDLFFFSTDVRVFD
jgi:hypothetical protein